MWKTVIVFLTFITIVWSEKVTFRVKRTLIINGSTIKISQAPYFASIVKKNKDSLKFGPICGAAIITNMWLLTAAHCIQPPIINLKVRTGFDKYFLPNNKEDDIHLHEIDVVKSHPNYKYMGHVNLFDIGLIKLKKPIKYIPKFQTPINLANSSFYLKPGSKLTVVGFGMNTNDNVKADSALPIKMLRGKVKVMKKEECERIYKAWFINKTDHHFCATSRKHEVAKGDSGGPAVLDSKIIGIISTGSQGKDQYPGLFIDVRKFIHWIRAIVGPELDRPSSQCCTIL